MSGVSWIFFLNAVLLPAVLTALSRRGSPAIRWGLIATVVWLDATWILWLSCQLSTIVYLALVVSLSSLTLPSELTQVLASRLRNARFILFFLALLTCSSLVHVHLPVGTFLTSPGEIGIHLEQLLTSNLTDAMAVVYGAVAVYTFAVVPKMRTVLVMIALVAVVLMIIYSYVLPFGYPMMNGLMFEQIPLPAKSLALRAILDAAIVFLVAFGLYHLILRAQPGYLVWSLVLTNISLISSTAYTAIGDDTKTEANETRGNPSSAQPLRFSREKPNVLIIFLDRFMGGFVEEILERDPHIKDDLDGFVWYPRTIAAGENSIAGVHPIFGGYDYTPQQMNERKGVLRDLSVEAYRILPHNFSQRGYQSNFVNPRSLGFTMNGDCSFLNDIEKMNCTHVAAHVSRRMAEQHAVPLAALSQANYSDLLSLLASMRALPFLMKGVVHKKGPWRPFLDHSAGTTFKQWAELAALPQLTKTDSSESNLNIFWNILPHEPYFMGKDCRPQQTQLDASPEEITQSGHSSLFALQHAVTARCSLLLVTEYLKWMKQHQIYHNTKIVIVSDHGIVGPVEDHSSRAQKGGTTDNLYVRSRSVLFVKDRDARGTLTISEEFMPNAEVPRIVCGEIGGCTNPYLEDRPIETKGRDDPFLVDFVPWQFNLQNSDSFVIKQRWQLRGRDPYSKDDWSPVAQP